MVKTRAMKQEEHRQDHAYLHGVPGGEELQHLKSQFLPTPKPGKKVKKPPRLPTAKRRKVTEYMAGRIYELHYNSGKSFAEISRLLHCPPATAFRALKRFESNGKSLVDQRKFNGRNNGKLKLSKKVGKYLLDRGVLQSWGGYCLQQRCLQLELDLGVKVVPSTLRNFYHKHDIRLRCVSFTYQQALRRSKGPILDFSLCLARMIVDDKTIVYFDESSFNMWMRGSKEWTPKDFPIKWSLNQTRGNGVTVFGAISTKMNRPLFM